MRANERPKASSLTIRQSLFAVLLLQVLLMTSLFLLLTRFALTHQIKQTARAELDQSRDNYRELERQRQDLLLRQAALLAELPSLKALMTTNDQPTIEDAGKSFWQNSGSDLFALMSPDGTLISLYTKGAAVDARECADALRRSRDLPVNTTLIYAGKRFFEVATVPIYFSDGENRMVLAYLAVGYELNDHLVAAVGRAPSSNVAFATHSGIIASTLGPAERQALESLLTLLFAQEGQMQRLQIAGADDLASSVLLQPSAGGNPAVYLIVLRSYSETMALLAQFDRGILALALVLLVLGVGLAFFLARKVTVPLENLLLSTRQIERGESVTPAQSSGPLEMRTLHNAFEKMHAEVLSSQARLVDAERQATIGRMASSMSHDLRHYLSPIYANAEFLTSKTLTEADRDELLAEISEAAHGMNEMLDSILAFSRTGLSVNRVPGSITDAVRRALVLIEAHPDAKAVRITRSQLQELSGIVDGRELQRAVYNLLLNACQAARISPEPCVSITVTLERGLTGLYMAAIRIRDNGPGVQEAIASRLFEPFVSSGKESGVGLGLALTRRIAEAHDGSAGTLRIAKPGGTAGETEFFLLLPIEQKPSQDYVRQGTE